MTTTRAVDSTVGSVDFHIFKMATGHDAGPPRKNPAYSPPWPGGGEPPRRLVAGAPARPARARAAAWSVLQQSPPIDDAGRFRRMSAERST
jgi:hypothetical protein